MKHLLPNFILLVIGLGAQAQEGVFPIKAGKVHYELVDSSFKDKTKGQLYSLSKLWLLDQFYDVKSFLEIDNPEEGLIAGRITFPYDIRIPNVLPSKCNFSFVIVSKDGRFKAQFYNFQLTHTSENYVHTYYLEPLLEPAARAMDTKKVLPKLEGQIYALMRSIQHEMEMVYTLMDF